MNPLVFAGVGLRHPCANRVQVCGCFGWGHTRLHPADQHGRVVTAIFERIEPLHERLLDDGDPEGRREEQLGAAEPFRPDADDGEWVPVDLNAPPYHSGVVMEVAMPVGVAEHDVRCAIRTLLIGGVEEAAEMRLHAEEVEVVAARQIGPCGRWMGAGIDADRADDLKEQQAIEAVIPVAQVLVVGIRLRRTLEALHHVEVLARRAG